MEIAFIISRVFSDRFYDFQCPLEVLGDYRENNVLLTTSCSFSQISYGGIHFCLVTYHNTEVAMTVLVVLQVIA